MIINEMPGGVSLGPTTASKWEVLNGYTAYNGDGELINGVLMSTPTTALGAQILNGYTAYSNQGTLLTGTALGTTTTATSYDIAVGKTAYASNGSLLTGALPSGAKAFSACTAAELISLAPYARTLLGEHIWEIGDTNTNFKYLSQYNYPITLVHVLSSADKQLYNTTGSVIVAFCSTVYIQGVFHSNADAVVNYNQTTAFNACQDLYSTKVTPNNVFKQITVPTVNANNTSINYATCYFFIPNIVELGQSNTLHPAEDSVSIPFTYYKGMYNQRVVRNYSYWTRSPYDYYNPNPEYHAYRNFYLYANSTAFPQYSAVTNGAPFYMCCACI